MSKRREFNSFVSLAVRYVTGSGLTILLGFVSFPLFTRLLSVEDYGLVNLVLQTAAILTAVAKLGLKDSIVRFHHEKTSGSSRSSLKSYYSTLLLGSMGAGIAVAAAFMIALWKVPPVWVLHCPKTVFAFAAGLVLARTVQSAVLGFFQSEGRSGAYNGLQISTRGATIVLACICVLAFSRSALGFLLGTAAAEISVVVVASAALVKRHLLALKNLDFSFLGTAVAFGAPLVGYEIASLILDVGDRFLIQRSLGAHAVGQYSAAYNVAGYLPQILAAPAGVALGPIYMRMWATEGKQATQQFLSRSLDLYLMVATGMVCAAVVCAPDLMTLLASKKYAEGSHLLPLLIIGLAVYGSHVFLNPGLVIARRTFTMAKLVFVAMVLNIVLNLVLLPRMGLKAAVLATLVSYALLIGLITFCAFRVLPIPIHVGSLVRCALAAGVSYALVTKVELSGTLQNLIVRGFLTVVLYGATVWCLDGRMRQLIRELCSSSEAKGALDSSQKVGVEVGTLE